MGRFQLFFVNGLTRLGKIQPISGYVYCVTLSTYLKVISVKVIFAGLLLLGLVSNTQATVIQQFGSGSVAPTTLGGYDMTVFDVTGGTGSETSIPTPIGGSISFLDRYGSSAALDRGLANSTSWWNNSGADYDIFTTSLLVLPENVQAFYFNVGADLPSGGTNAWLNATSSNGSVTSKKWFSVNEEQTPGFGVYNETSDCSSSIKSVTIDPLLWGFGNFSISQGSCGVSVPESNSLYLLLFGLLGLLVTARRKI